MQGAEQGILPKLFNWILMTTLLSHHHSSLNEETEVLQNEATCPVYKASKCQSCRSALVLSDSEQNALSLCKTAADDKRQALNFIYITSHVNKYFTYSGTLPLRHFLQNLLEAEERKCKHLGPTVGTWCICYKSILLEPMCFFNINTKLYSLT